MAPSRAHTLPHAGNRNDGSYIAPALARAIALGARGCLCEAQGNTHRSAAGALCLREYSSGPGRPFLLPNLSEVLTALIAGAVISPPRLPTQPADFPLLAEEIPFSVHEVSNCSGNPSNCLAGSAIAEISQQLLRQNSARAYSIALLVCGSIGVDRDN